MSDKQLILAFFADQPAAEVAALTLNLDAPRELV